MKLFNIAHSPYAARVRIQISARNLPVDIVEPPGGLGSEEYKAKVINGKVPALEVEGKVLAESAAIMDFLEDHFADSPLRSKDQWQAAQERAAIRFVDLEFAKVLFPLFQQLSAKPRDEVVVAAALIDLDAQLLKLQRWYNSSDLAQGADLSLFDCSAIPVLFYVVTLAPLFGKADVLSATPTLAARWEWAKMNPHTKKVIDEMNAGLKMMMGG